MSITDIIPDIHGQACKLHSALTTLGWQRSGTNWSHAEQDRRIVFLGDFIDRGPENGAVIKTVRELMDSGRAQAIMGNHELNALHYHTFDSDTGLPLREHSEKNTGQHKAFLNEFPTGAPKTKEALDWMMGLPLFIENDEFRAVHAAWIQSAIDGLRLYAPNGVLSEEQMILAADTTDPLHIFIEDLAKGPEGRLPNGCFFIDNGGHKRCHIHLKWWKGDAKTWREAAMSIANLDQLPDGQLPASLKTAIYPADEKPVFFGHYWMSGEPKLQSKNALCLDYSVGKGGNLVTYTFASGSRKLSSKNLIEHKGI